ncbi:MAG: dihydrodipicolinate synthase family protein [Synergistaceae bacterium]|jgi:4-hydroxy-2-oxoglutarate aldolase|nr:dihydrodipicolinate synthase family protein [Synergistaceae bacterium]
MKLEGIYAPVPTPFKPDGSEEIFIDAFRDNLKKWAGTSLAGVVICGSNGELPFTSMDERALLTKTAREILGTSSTSRASETSKKIVAGTYMNTTKDTILCCKNAADAGADAALLLPPHYFKGQGMPAAIKFFEAVADKSPIPVILYNMPGNTGVNLDSETILHLADHPNIIGVKDTSGDLGQMCYIASTSGKNFSAFSGSGNYLLPAMSVGASGGTLAVANLYPESCQKLMETFKNRRLDEALDLQRRVLTASDALTRKFGVPGLKLAMDRAGLYGGPCRAPLQPLGEETKKKLFALLDESNLDPFEKWR